MERIGKLVANDILVRDIHRMTFDMGECEFRQPGQYANLGVGDHVGPYQVCDFDSNRFTIVFPIIDEPSEILAKLRPGDDAIIATGLGKGFDLDKIPDEVILVADDVGIPEMLGLVRRLVVRGKKCKMVLGYPSKNDIYMLSSFTNLVSEIEVLTLDGSNGREGGAAEGVKHAAYVCASGSLPMLKELAGKVDEGQFSLSGTVLAESSNYEECFIETTEGRLNCADDGPVFDKNIILWDKLI